MNKKNDVLIVGNGILGYMTAYALLEAEPNLRLGLVGPEHRVGSASTASGAMLSCFGEITSQALVTKPAQYKFDISLKALRIWPEWLEKLNQKLPDDYQVDYIQGTTVILNSCSGVLDSMNFEAMCSALKSYEEPSRMLNPHDIIGLNPRQNTRPLQSIHLPNEGSLDPLALLRALRFLLAQQASVTFYNHHVEYLNPSSFDKELHSVVLDDGQVIAAKKILLAAGSFTQKFIDQVPAIRDKIPRMFSGMGFSVLIKQDINKPIEHVIRTPNRAGACGLHVLPRGAEWLYVGATNNVMFLPQQKLTVGLSAFLTDCLVEQINQDLYSAEIHGWSVGNRPLTLDGFPLIGETSIPGLFILSGTYRDGLHQSPILAEYITHKILTGNDSFQHIFHPERALIKIKTVKESISESLEHYLAGLYEHGMTKLSYLSDSRLIKFMESEISSFYRELDTNFGLIPDILLLIEFASNKKSTARQLRHYLNTIPHQSFIEDKEAMN